MINDTRFAFFFYFGMSSQNSQFFICIIFWSNFNWWTWFDCPKASNPYHILLLNFICHKNLQVVVGYRFFFLPTSSIYMFILLYTRFLWSVRFGWLLVLNLFFLQKFKCVPFWVHGFCGKWEGCVPVNRFNHTSWITVGTPTDRPKSVCNRCVIEVLVAFLCFKLVVEFSVGIRAFVIGLSQI